MLEDTERQSNTKCWDFILLSGGSHIPLGISKADGCVSKRCKEVVNHRLFFHIGCRIQSDASRNRAKEWLSFNHQGKVADQRSD